MSSVTTITPQDEAYPALLKEIHEPPPRLFVRGNVAALQQKGVAIVGTRRCSSYGRTLSRSFARELGEAGATIISGLALGVDAAAHEGALEAKAPTVAVLGSGVGNSSIYPQRNISLARRIIDAGGAVLSEYEDETPTYPSNFLQRNRIIAGLARAVVVTEAPARSGALSTARHAMEEGRDVYAIPGPITSRLSEGTNALLKQGASPATRTTDILDAIPRDDLTPPNKQGTQQALPEEEERVLAVLRNAAGPLHMDELLAASGLTPQEAASAILSLTLAGHITEIEAATYTISP